MYFIYIDESGACGFDPVQHFFVLAAVVVNVEQCRLIQEKVKRVKQDYSLGDIEIKGRDIEQRKNIFKHITPESKKGLVNRLFEVLLTNNLSLFSVVFSKREESIQRLNMSPDDIYHYTYKHLIANIEEFLETQNDDGMLLIDSRASSLRSSLRDDRLIHFHQTCLNELSRKGKPIHIVEYPVFVQSEFFAAVQLADFCAYNIFHALQIQFGQPELEDKTTFMPPIDHAKFQNAEFIESLFSHSQ